MGPLSKNKGEYVYGPCQLASIPAIFHFFSDLSAQIHSLIEIEMTSHAIFMED